MMKQTVAAMILASIVALFCPSGLVAQTAQTKQEQKTAKVKDKIKKLGLGERVKITVKLNDETSYKGFVREANDDNFVVVDKVGSPHIVRYDEVKSVAGHNLSTGAKIGIGIGIGAGAVLLVLAILIASLDD